MLSWQWPSDVQLRAGRHSSVAHRPRKIDAHLYEHFAGLAGATDEKVRRFSERWGPLRYANMNPETESIQQWQRFASLGRALLRCTVAIGRNEPGQSPDWLAICAWLNIACDADLARPTPRLPDVVALQRHLLIVSALNRWYSRSKGHTLMHLQSDRLIIQPAANTLFGIIGVQLSLRVASSRQKLACYHCARLFTPQRKPSTGSRVFCPACRATAKPQMYAMRDYRNRAKPLP